jgi:hypothetical protein
VFVVPVLVAIAVTEAAGPLVALHLEAVEVAVVSSPRANPLSSTLGSPIPLRIGLFSLSNLSPCVKMLCLLVPILGPKVDTLDFTPLRWDLISKQESKSSCAPTFSLSAFPRVLSTNTMLAVLQPPLVAESRRGYSSSPKHLRTGSQMD